MSRTEIGVHVVFGVSRQRLGPQEGSGGGPQDQGVQLQLLFRFPGDEKGAIVTVLVEREQVTGMTLASERNIVAAMYVPDFIRECGAAETEIALKTDEGAAIEALMADVVLTR